MYYIGFQTLRHSYEILEWGTNIKASFEENLMKKIVLDKGVESQIFSLYSDGYNRSEIANLLSITEWSVRKSLFGKTKRQSKFVKLASKYIFIRNSTYSNTNLRKRLVDENLLEYVCSECGLGGCWQDKSLTLQVDHINGVSNDNRLENLRFLCYNCHSQTSTFSGRNRKIKKNKTIKDSHYNEYCPNVSFRQKKNPIWGVSFEKFKSVVESSETFSEMLNKLCFPQKGAQYKALKERIYWEGISFSHIKCGKSHNLGRRFQRESLPLEEVMIKDSKYPNYLLKKRLFQEGLFEERCVDCGLKDSWNDKKLILQIHHINGVSNDHSLDNLSILCPNCHSQTSNYAGKNVQIDR